jgi:hypothetical protein
MRCRLSVCSPTVAAPRGKKCSLYQGGGARDVHSSSHASKGCSLAILETQWGHPQESGLKPVLGVPSNQAPGKSDCTRPTRCPLVPHKARIRSVTAAARPAGRGRGSYPQVTRIFPGKALRRPYTNPRSVRFLSDRTTGKNCARSSSCAPGSTAAGRWRSVTGHAPWPLGADPPRLGGRGIE